MDDDFNFGTSIWASDTPPTTETLVASSSKTTASPFPSETEDAFGDDDFDFNAPQASTSANVDDDFDDFGDFGDAVEGDTLETFNQETTSFNDNAFIPGAQSSDWETLRLNPLPSSSSLKKGIGDLLESFWDTREASQYLRDENIRQVGGLNQILVTPERYEWALFFVVIPD